MVTLYTVQQHEPIQCISSSLKEEEKINSKEWPICIRLSNNGQDIRIQVPTQPPYLTLAGLRHTLLPHLNNSSRVKFIYLGRILSDQHVIVPTPQPDSDLPLPPPKNRTIQIQKEGVIQAMISTISK
ncbi:MAG: hypothetical protein EXX96DRAFT_587225 [Benjaminiella poitrasii]|nr:MAG: hypothetical protein EXX96DRAFT_587225 [Benjaminiella poitrasii]